MDRRGPTVPVSGARAEQDVSRQVPGRLGRVAGTQTNWTCRRSLANWPSRPRRRRWLRRCRKKPWVVYSQAPFAGPRKLLDYLGRYTHRVAISNHRILACRGRPGPITAIATAATAIGSRSDVLPAEEFLHRFLQHVLPDRFLRIRHYGLLANCVKRDGWRSAATCWESAPPAADDRPQSAADWMLVLLGIDITRCPCVAAAALQTRSPLRASRPPTAGGPRPAAFRPGIPPEPRPTMIQLPHSVRPDRQAPRSACEERSHRRTCSPTQPVAASLHSCRWRLPTARVRFCSRPPSALESPDIAPRTLGSLIQSPRGSRVPPRAPRLSSTGFYRSSLRDDAIKPYTLCGLQTYVALIAQPQRYQRYAGPWTQHNNCRSESGLASCCGRG